MTQIQKIPHYLLELLTLQLTKRFSHRPNLSVFLIGSWSRNEGRAELGPKGINPISDIEFYCLDETMSEIDLNDIKKEICSVLINFDVDVGGTSYDRFKNFTPRLWLYDVAHFHKIILASKNYPAPFQPFLNEIPTYFEILHLCLNHYVQFLNNRNSLHHRVKIWRALATLILRQIGEYQVLLSQRRMIWQLESTQNKILNLPYIQKNKALFNIMDSFLISDFSNHAITHQGNNKSHELFLITRLLASSILWEDHSTDEFSPPATVYSKYILSHGQVSREWLRTLYRYPQHILKLRLFSLPPRFQTYADALNFNSIGLSEINSHWNTFCKSA